MGGQRGHQWRKIEFISSAGSTTSYVRMKYPVLDRIHTLGTPVAW